MDLPDVILVRKHYPNRRNKRRQRNWKLDSLGLEDETSMRKTDRERYEDDYEMFLRDIEEDPEMRAEVNLYKADVNANEENEENEEKEDDFPEVASLIRLIFLPLSFV